jgi:Uma2 family endonuclease
MMEVYMKSLRRTVEPILTISDLDATPDDGNRYELIEGVIYMSCSPNLKHQMVLHNLQFEIELFLRSNPIGFICPGIGVIFDDFNGVIPDLVFISNEQQDEIASGDRVYGAPDLAIEIISPGSENEKRDRGIKRQLYGFHKVKEYWIVDPENRRIEVYKLKKRKLELENDFNTNDELTSPVLKGFRLKLGNIFTR